MKVVNLFSLRAILQKVKSIIRECIFSITVEKISIGTEAEAHDDEAIVCCLVRDGATYIPEFISHYRDLGVKSFVFLDNGSTDNTIDLLIAQDDISVYRTTRPYKIYKNIMKRWLVRRFGSRNWVLCVDIDEFFDYPFRKEIPLRELLLYLNARGANAVVAQLLDLFPRASITKEEIEFSREDHCFYSLDGLERESYGEYYKCKNEIPNINLDILFGGVRAQKFDVRALLTKHPLLFPSRGVVMYHAHHVSGAKLADFSAVLLHYKFVGTFLEYSRRIVSEKSFSMGSREYKKYLNVFESSDVVDIYDYGAKFYSCPEQLIEDKFLVVGAQYCSYAGFDEEIHSKTVD